MVEVFCGGDCGYGDYFGFRGGDAQGICHAELSFIGEIFGISHAHIHLVVMAFYAFVGEVWCFVGATGQATGE